MAVPDAGMRHGRQQGVALITALLVVALAVSAATAMATRLQVDVRRTGNLLHGEQAYAYALSAESWAYIILRKDAGESEYDALDEDWATALPPISVEGGIVSGRITDLQGRFNVNNLVAPGGKPDQVQVDYFKRLLTVLKLDPELSAALLDWIDADINATFPGGAEDDAYLLLDPPYRAANRPLVSISELQLIQGFTAEAVAALAPHVTALPKATAINVNTATPQVLLALDEDITEQGVEALVAEREQKPFTDNGDFLAHDSLAGVDPTIPPTGVSSDWFQVSTDVHVGNGQARVQSLLERDSGKLHVVSRVRTGERLLPPG
jgi:general secretion pathway protein K